MGYCGKENETEVIAFPFECQYVGFFSLVKRKWIRSSVNSLALYPHCSYYPPVSNRCTVHVCLLSWEMEVWLLHAWFCGVVWWCFFFKKTQKNRLFSLRNLLHSLSLLTYQ